MALTQAGVAKLRNAVVLLRETPGFIYLPILVPHEVAGRDVINELLSASAVDPQSWHELAWPTTVEHADTETLATQRTELLERLDAVVRGPSHGQTVVIDASPISRHALAAASINYFNLRREPLRTRGHRLILVWPQALAETLRGGAPDLWSQRALAPMLEAEDVRIQPPLREAQSAVLRPQTKSLNPVLRAQLARWFATHDLVAADLSLRDALSLAKELYDRRDLVELRAISQAIEKSAAPESTEAAAAMDFQSVALSLEGQRVEALTTANVAVEIRRRLAQVNPAAEERDLAASLNNLANFQSETGDRTGALETARAAVKILRRLAQANPAAYEPVLATSLNNLANFQSATGDRAGALETARAAVEIYRRLAQANPSAYEPDLAMSLINLATRQSETGDRTGALETARAAVEIYRRLAQANPAAYEPDLSGSLLKLADFQSKTGDRTEALETARAAVEIRRRLAQANPAAYEPDLARSLSVLAMLLGENGELAEARSTAKASVDLLQPWAKRMPDAFGPLFGAAHQLYDQLCKSE